MSRRMEVRSVSGLPELLYSVVLTTPNSRLVEPSPELQDQVLRLGNAFILAASHEIENEGTTVYAAYQWPESGPAVLAFVWAINTRHPVDPEDSAPFFFRAFTETKETHEHLLSRDQMEHELALYAVTQFGKPRAI